MRGTSVLADILEQLVCCMNNAFLCNMLLSSTWSMVRDKQIPNGWECPWLSQMAKSKTWDFEMKERLQHDWIGYWLCAACIVVWWAERGSYWYHWILPTLQILVQTNQQIRYPCIHFDYLNGRNHNDALSIPVYVWIVWMAEITMIRSCRDKYIPWYFPLFICWSVWKGADCIIIWAGTCNDDWYESLLCQESATSYMYVWC